MKMTIKAIFSILILSSVTHAFAESKDIVGKWRNIDDKTGFSKAIIEINKDDQGVYHGTIIDVIPRPGYNPKKYCDKCKGEEKGKPIIGLKIVKDMKRDPKNANQYANGTILDPLSGHQYKSTIRLNSAGSRLSIRGFVGVEALGRSQTWLRQD